MELEILNFFLPVLASLIVFISEATYQKYKYKFTLKLFLFFAGV